MTNRICAAYCASYSYFATEYSTEFYCGNALNANSPPVTDKRCNMPCKANSTEICGGPNGLTLFRLDLSASSSSSLSSSASSTISSSTSSTVSSSATFTTRLALSAVSSDSSSVSSSTSSSISSSVSSSTISATSSSASVSASSSVSSSTPVTTSSSTSTVASTTSSQLPVITPLKCLGDNGATYVSNSQTFLVECGKDYAGNDIKGVGVTVNDLKACINICATTVGCKSVALSGAACYLKSGVGPPNNNGVWGARVIAVAASSSTTSSSITTSASSSSFVTSTISPTSSSTLSLSSSSILSSTVSSSSSTPAVTSTSVSTSSSSSSSFAPSSTLLSSSASSTPVPSSTSFSPSSASSTPMVTPISSSASSSTSTPTHTLTPTPSSATPTGPIVAPTAGIYYSLGCYSEPSGGRALSEVYANYTMTIEMCAAEAQKRQYDYMGVEYGTECWMGDSLDTSASLQQAQSKCSILCPGNKLNYCGAGGTLQIYMLNSTLATPRTEVPAGQALACPSNDDQAWTASTGARFRIECGWDRNGGASSKVTVSSYESCLETCAKTTGCGSVALSGTDCYIKTGTLGARVKKDGIRGGTLLKK